MPNKEYEQILERLLTINNNGGIKLGLETPLKLAHALGNPHQTFPSIHIAGTNGKGSVTTKIAAAFQAAGLKVGRYTSPHISCFRERICINGQKISKDEVLKQMRHIFSIVDNEHIPGTYFELTTLLAFMHFAVENVDIAIIETGLGGRLDATNIIHPILSVITSISLDHTEYLGDTIELIALEKAGIIKATVPVVIGPRVPYHLIKTVAENLKCPLIQVKESFIDYHAENNCIAKKALETVQNRYSKVLTSDAIELGLHALPPCRLEIIPETDVVPMIILDAAHNPDGFQGMLTAIRHRFPKHSLRFLIGLSSNKDIEGCLKIIKDDAVHFHLIEANSDRAISTAAIQNTLLHLNVESSRITCEASIPSAIESIMKQVKKSEIIVVCGTFFILHDVKSALDTVFN